MAESSSGRLPLAAQLGISLAIAAVVLVAFWYFFWGPMVTELEEKQARLETLQKDIRNLEVTASKLQEFQQEVAQLESKLETLKRILPPQKEVDDLIRKIQNLASDSSLRLTQFSPGAAVTKEAVYQEYPITLGIEGSYHNLAMFFDRISRLSRLVNAGNLNVGTRSPQTISMTVRVSCVASTFVYIDAPPPPARAGATK
jgi:type IV pilus assembly protein PilO